MLRLRVGLIRRLPQSWWSRTMRSLFIRTQETPNPSSLKFLPQGATLLESGTIDFPNLKQAQISPLARSIFQVEKVRNVLLATDFVSVTIEEDGDWMLIKPQVFGVLTDFFASGQPLLLDTAAEQTVNADTIVHDDDDDTVAMIKELLELRIRPHIQQDGGDIKYMGYEDGYVKLQLQGSCVGCPSSAGTLSGGIENMLKHYIPEVKGVKEVKDEELDRVSHEQLDVLESRLKHKEK